MATVIYSINIGVKNSSLFPKALSSLTFFVFLVWVNVTVSASPPTPKIDNDRRSPLSEQLLDPSRDWRKPEGPKNSWREEKDSDQKENKSRIESKRFKPYFYDPKKEGDAWDPYSSGSDNNANPKPPTLFRFQF